jgi:hypothetical protein
VDQNSGCNDFDICDISADKLMISIFKSGVFYLNVEEICIEFVLKDVTYFIRLQKVSFQNCLKVFQGIQHIFFHNNNFFFTVLIISVVKCMYPGSMKVNS